MKASDLVTVWSAPDNSRLTNKQISLRLPVHVAAKLAALDEMYPTKTRTQLVGDLLAAALADVERGFPYVQGNYIGKDHDSGEEIHEDAGPVLRFRHLANKHYALIEAEMGNENPGTLY